MSRRIAFVTLAVSATLIATHAAAAEPTTVGRGDRAPVAIAAPAPGYFSSQNPFAVDVPRQAPAIANAAVIEVPGEIQTSDGLVTVYPNLRPDPAWKLCQIDTRELEHRAYRCTAYSYHPYGEGGYRPYGTYSYRSHPVDAGYAVAPSARIIAIRPND